MVKSMLLVAALTLASSSASADCAMWGLVPKVATPLETPLVGGGGILVAAVPESGGPMNSGDAALLTTWKLRDGTTPKKVKIAPGLAVYQVPFTDQVTPVELLDGTRVIGSVVGSKAKVAQFPAPIVKSIVVSTAVRRRSAETIEIELDGKVPEGVYAIVLADAKGNARTWNVVTAGTSQVRTFNHEDCRALPNDSVPSKIGDRVTLFWVNAHGRTSDRTRSMTIKAAAKP